MSKSAVAERAAQLLHPEHSLVPVPASAPLIQRGISETEALAKAGEVFEALTNALKDGVRIFPLGDRILIKKLDPAQLTRAGLHIPSNAQEETCVGVVLGAGQGRITENSVMLPMQVQPGMIVIFGKYAGTGIPVGAVTDGDQLILCQDEIFGIVCNRETAALLEKHAIPPMTGARVGE